MAVYKRGGVWWYKFRFAGRMIRESAKTESKTVARSAEKQRTRELEERLALIAPSMSAPARSTPQPGQYPS